MSALYTLRQQVRDALVTAGIWTTEEIIIRRRAKIWNEVATATNASEHGACLVIGTAKGDADRGRKPKSRLTIMDVTVPVTLIELPEVDPDAGDDEDARWEATVKLLQGNDLGRGDKHDFIFEGFDDLEDERYVIRQTLFKTRLILNPGT